MFGGKPQPPPKPEQPKPELPDLDSLPPEVAWIVEWRKQLLMGDGFPEDEAEILAGLLYIDHWEAAEYRRRGCDFTTLLRILAE